MKRLALFVALTTVTTGLFAAPLVVYSERSEQLIKPLLDTYTAKTGVEIQVLTDDAAPLIARLKAEGNRTPADVLITVDAGNLWHAAESGMLAKVDSPILETRVPDYLQDPNNQWFALTVRARTIVYSTDRVTPAQLSTYEDLASPAWKGKLCLRTSKKVYNQSLVGSLINRLGDEGTRAVVDGWVNNLATEPQSSDTKALEAVIAGQCDVAIVNTYYFGRMQKANPDVPLAIFWPNQATSGVHINVSGAGITKHSKQPEAAQAFLEWMVSDEAQEIYANLDMEYPVVKDVAVDPVVAKWGTFKPDTRPVYKSGEYQRQAVMLMDAAQYR